MLKTAVMLRTTKSSRRPAPLAVCFPDKSGNLQAFAYNRKLDCICHSQSMDISKKEFFLLSRCWIQFAGWLRKFPLSSKCQECFSFLLKKWQKNTVTNYIGLDISADAIKILKINTAVLPNQVENFSVVPLPVDAIAKDIIKNPAIVISELKKLSKLIVGKVKLVAIAIPRSSAILKNITVGNRLTPREVESRAWVEASRYFPDLIDDSYLDFDVLGPSAQDNSQLDVVLVACRKKHIQPFLDVLDQGDFTVKLVDVNCYAFERAFAAILQPKSDAAVALLNLDATLSTLVVSQANYLAYAHDQSFDGRRLVNEVRQKIQDSGKNITDPFTSSGDLGDAEYLKILKENLSAHLRHTMHFFYSSRPNVAIDKVVLSGECATIPHLAVFVQQEIGIETVIANPFVDMAIAPDVDAKALYQYAPMLMLSCGLALSKSS